MSQLSSCGTLIVGAGGAGLAAAYYLGDLDYLLVDQADRVGGSATTWEVNGYSFDSAIHVFYTRDASIGRLVETLLEGRLVSASRRSFIHYRGRETPYPLQANLRGQRADVVCDCVLGLLVAHLRRFIGSRPPRNFDEWTVDTFGSGFARHFGRPFNSKTWTVPLVDMSIGWVGDRVPVPSLIETLRGAISSRPATIGPNAHFKYPEIGGYKAICEALAHRLPPDRVHLNTAVTNLSSARREVTLHKVSEPGNPYATIGYEQLISSAPLASLIAMMDDVPEEITEAARRLRWNKLYLVNIGIRRPRISEKHWIQFPEDRFPFYRVSFPSNLSPAMAPPGCSSLTAEVAVRPGVMMDHGTLVRDTRRGLIECGLLRETDEVDVEHVQTMEPGYLIPTHETESAVATIQQFLARNQIWSVGRFGGWKYLNLDQAMREGITIAIKVRHGEQSKRRWLDAARSALEEDFQQAQASFASTETRGHVPIDARSVIVERFMKVADLVLSGQIEPFADLRLAENDSSVNRDLVPLQRVTRVGVLAVTGDPLHWGHINSALTAVALYRLDTVIFICQGLGNYKPGMSPRNQRHEMVRIGVQDLFPLLRYSPIGYDNALLGESNVFEVFRLNPGRDLSVHYVVGREKVSRVASDLADLASRYEFKRTASAKNELAVAVVNRGTPDGPVGGDDGRVRVLAADCQAELSISSTQIRQAALNLACPRRVLEFVQNARLYRGDNRLEKSPSSET